MTQSFWRYPARITASARARAAAISVAMAAVFPQGEPPQLLLQCKQLSRGIRKDALRESDIGDLMEKEGQKDLRGLEIVIVMHAPRRIECKAVIMVGKGAVRDGGDPRSAHEIDQLIVFVRVHGGIDRLGMFAVGDVSDGAVDHW